MERAKTRLTTLSDALAVLELDVEFYFLGGAVLHQAFAARPPTAHVSALFRPSALVRESAAKVAAREGWPYEWLSDAVKSCLRGAPPPGPYVELDHVRVFIPPLEYALAVKVAALRVGREAPEVEDVRYLLRALNLTSVPEALAVVRQYFSDGQIAAPAKDVLEELLAG